MIGLGTIINTAAVVVGGLIGLGLKNGLKKQLQDSLMRACGVATIFIGAVFSAVPIFVYQGTITLIAAVGGAFIGDEVIADLAFIGSALIFCVGVNIAFGKRFKVGNMLPALMVPVVYHFLGTF